MTWRTRLPILLIFLPAQTILFEAWRIGGIKPDLALVLVVAFALTDGAMAGLLWGLALGGLVDLASIGALDANVIFKAVAGLFCGIAGQVFIDMAFWVKPFFFILISLLHDHAGNLVLYNVHSIALALQDPETVRAFYGAIIVLLLSMKITRGTIDDAGPLFSPGQGSGTRT